MPRPVALLLLLVGCFNPPFANGKIQCEDRTGACPSGFSCGSDGFCYQTGTGPPVPSLDQSATDRASAFCTRLDACRPNGAELRYGSLDVCVARNKMFRLFALGANGSGATAASEEACAKGILKATCADFFAANIDLCLPRFGSLPVETPCRFGTQCTTAFCRLPPHSVCGVCGDPPAIGTSCAQSNCDEGQFCGDDGLCHTLGIAGDPCWHVDDCQFGFGCVFAMGLGTQGVCQQAVTMANGACDTRMGPPCAFDLQQACINHVCVPDTYATGGQTCGLNTDSSTLCTGGASCLPPTGTRTCVAPAADGAACDFANGPPCLSPATCVRTSGGTAGTCKLPDSSGC